MGEVVEVGREVHTLKKGDRVVVPFINCCGACFFCKTARGRSATHQPQRRNRREPVQVQRSRVIRVLARLWRIPGWTGAIRTCGLGRCKPAKIPNGITDEQVLFLSDILPAGYMAVDNCNILPGDTVAVWGCGPVGQFAIQSAWLLGAEQVITLDHIPQRLSMAETYGKAKVIDYEDIDVVEKFKELTGGRGPDACIDAVGMEAHGSSLEAIYSGAKQAAHLETDRPHVLRQAIQACRKGGTVSIPGLYDGVIDKFPIGAAFAKGLTLKMGRTRMRRNTCVPYWIAFSARKSIHRS